MSDAQVQTEVSSDYIVVTQHNQVVTLTMNRPKKLNGWTLGMMSALRGHLQDAAVNDGVKAVILTGTGRYYSAGVNLAGSFKLMHPAKLYGMIVEHNQKLFELFLDFPKPIIVAANGPAIGASVTSAILCDAVFASENATFSTPFARLGVPPEGCSSVLFERLMGVENAERMLGKAGWVPTAKEAVEAGLIHAATTAENLLPEAQVYAEALAAKSGTRSYPANSDLEELKEVNRKESIGVANAFLSAPFLKEQSRFLWSKKKRAFSMIFFGLWLSRPLWGGMLPKQSESSID